MVRLAHSIGEESASHRRDAALMKEQHEREHFPQKGILVSNDQGSMGADLACLPHRRPPSLRGSASSRSSPRLACRWQGCLCLRSARLELTSLDCVYVPYQQIGEGAASRR